MSKKTYRVSARGGRDIDKHLSKSTNQAIRKLKVPKSSLCDKLWQDNAELRKEALNTNWIQGIRNGNLDPNDYGGYMVQDSVYCSHVTENIGLAKWKSTENNIHTYLEAQEKGLKEYTATMFKDWHIAFEGGIKMGPALQLYGSFEKSVAMTMDSVYFLIAMLPCYRLWPELAIEIDGKGPDDNVYQFWIDGNKTSKSYVDLQKLIDSVEGVDEKQAQTVFRTCMQGEVNFFTSAA